MDYALCIITALCIIIACTNDNTAGMPDGKTPMALTATCASTTTRTTVDGNWADADGKQVGVMIGDKVKPYTITANYSEADLTSTDPHYWTKAKETVTAWYPYTEGETELPPVTVKDNQFEWNDYLGSDCLAAVEQEVTYGGSTALEFSHRTAKIEITVTNQNGGTDLPHYYEVMEVTISTDGGNRVIKTCPAPAASNLLWNALIPPTTAAANNLVITVTTGNGNDDSNNKKYRYKHPEPQTFEANKRYVLTLKVGEHDLVLDGCTIKPWESATDTPETGIIEQKDFFVVDGVYHVKTAAGLQAWATKVANDTKLNAVLENDIDMTDETWTPIPTYIGTFNGNGHTISNLTINTTSTRSAFGTLTGFIGTLNGGTVKNLTLRNVNITGKSYTGAIVGSCINGSYIYCCQVTGKVKGTSSVGGIVGYSNRGKIIACSASGTVEATLQAEDKNVMLGGIIGEAYSTNITSSWAACDLVGKSGDPTIAGITGNDDSKGVYTACYWKSSSATRGVYIESKEEPADVHKLENSMEWSDYIQPMNDVLKERRDIFYEWAEDTDSETNPLKLKRK